ncbi:hypothetical protein ACFXKD_27850 [Nocardiopsis aegyptia]|uniref:hypothetical protein n=1 Tax=Nocardiopsis aegyptia TaxID=220378 RepID=UPI00366F6EAD
MPEYPHYSLDGVALNDPADRWFLDGGAFQVPPLPGARAVDVAVPGVHGVLPVAGLDLESTVLGGQLIITDTTPGGVSGGPRQLQDNLASVYALLGGRERMLDLRYHLDEATVRQADALMIASTTPDLLTTTTARLALLLQVPGALWRDTDTSTWGPATLATLAAAAEVDTLTGSTGPITDAIIRIRGTASQPSVTDTGTGGTVTYTGSLTSGQRLLLDCARMRAARVSTDTWDLSAGTDVTGAIAATGPRSGSRWLHLAPQIIGADPAIRQIRITAAAASQTGATVEIRARRAYL